VVCNFPYRVYSLPLLSLFLSILFFEAIINGIVFLYFSQCVHCWYIEKLWIFCKLILYPATLLKLFVMSRRSMVEFFESFRYKIMSYTNRDSLTSSLPICIF
jgi:hypothetical protein